MVKVVFVTEQDMLTQFGVLPCVWHPRSESVYYGLPC